MFKSRISMVGSANYTCVGLCFNNILYSRNVALDIMSPADRPNCKLVGALLLQYFRTFLLVFQFKVVPLMEKNVHKGSFCWVLYKRSHEMSTYCVKCLTVRLNIQSTLKLKCCPDTKVPFSNLRMSFVTRVVTSLKYLIVVFSLQSCGRKWHCDELFLSNLVCPY